MKLAAASLVLLAAAAVPGVANADVTIYSNNFEAPILGPEWSSNSVLAAAPAFTQFNGRYSGGYTQLSLGYPVIGNPTTVTSGEGGGAAQIVFHVTFDFYAIDSWDGDANYINYLGQRAGPDWLDVTVNQANVFHETFNNRGYTQTFREPDQPRTDLGFVAQFQDAIYRSVTVDFMATPNEPIVIRWQDSGLQGLADESWGIDNVSVSYSAVPAPGSLALAGGLLALGGRRRRR